ncbi:MAG: hypothetical protein QGD89_05260 [Actinomycetota bacterium]|nr:hypothetical protein [Actinomycetota bacterium]
MRFAVVGDPVKHSKSPAIHNAGFEVLGIDAAFDFMRIPLHDFGSVVQALRAEDLDGVSVTMPHKHNAFAAADEVSDAALRTRSVNTLVMKEGRLLGYNTDVAGVTHALSEVGDTGNAPILILGSGGAAAAALVAVEGRDVLLSGRDATTVAALLDTVSVAASAVPWGTSISGAVVINATPLGMHGEDLPLPVVEEAVALIDMAYGEEVTPAVTLALRLDIPAADGLTMLVGQAVAAFQLFVDRRGPIHAMEEAVRSASRHGRSRGRAG